MLSIEPREPRGSHTYLIQHSTGRGTSNSITWLANKLVGLQSNDEVVFDSIIVLTNRINPDKQIYKTIKDFNQVSSALGHSTDTGELQKFIQDDKQIIVTIVFKFLPMLEEIDNARRNNRYAIIIDEAQ